MKIPGISFVFPMYNEADNIASTVDRAISLAREIAPDYEVVVVDDASTDGCGEIMDAFAARDPHVRSIRLSRNTKFGGALKEGLRAASKDIVVYTDSDFPAREEDIKKAVSMLDGADIVSAYSLVIKDSNPKRIAMSRVYNFLVQSFFGLSLRDVNSGLKAYRRPAIEGLELSSKSPFIDVEIFAEASRRGARIQQYGLIFDLRRRGRSSISRPGVIARTFWDMLRYRFFRFRRSRPEAEARAEECVK